MAMMDWIGFLIFKKQIIWREGETLDIPYLFFDKDLFYLLGR